MHTYIPNFFQKFPEFHSGVNIPLGKGEEDLLGESSAAKTTLPLVTVAYDR